MSNSQLNKLKLWIKNDTEISQNLSSNIVGIDETSFPCKWLLTGTQVSEIRKAFANGSSANINISQKLNHLGWYS